MFRRKKAPELTNDAYRRWLRAQRPPLALFLGLSELEQEALAELGDEHAADFAVAVGYAVADPQAADAGVSAAQGDAAGDESLALRLAEGLAQKLAGRTPPPPVPAGSMPRETLAGFSGRRQVEHKHPRRSTLFGRPADTPDEVNAP